MTPQDITHTLQEGIDAVKSGQAERAVQLLMQVVAADENNEQGWLWLSYVVTDPKDKIIALENVLTINPANRVAQQNLTRWQTQVDSAPSAATVTPPLPAAAASPTSTDSSSGYAPYSPVEAISAIDNIFQCVYCGAAAERETRKCPECGRNLYAKRILSSRHTSYMLRSAIFVTIIQFALAIIELATLASLTFQGRNFIVAYIIETLNLRDFFGDYLSWSAMWSQALLWIAVIRIGVFLALMVGLAARFTVAYYAAIVFMSFDILWTAVRWVYKFLGPFSAIADIAADIVGLAFVFASDRDFAINDERMLCQPDPRIKGGAELNRRARMYRLEGKWALAVAYWRAAIGQMPQQPEFYKNVAIGYAQIGYYQRALNAIGEAHRQSPVDAEIPRIRELIEDKQKKDTSPRG
jgi:tetratricopeptide (TPR) repeat protein